MKNWLSIGQFADKVSLTEKALRLYEEKGILIPSQRGENNYRYYTVEQIEVAERIKQFKDLGFSLGEVKSLLEVDQSMSSEKLKEYLSARLQRIHLEIGKSKDQEQQIQIILSSLKNNHAGLAPEERRFIMTQFEKLSVVVAGTRDLEKTATFIQGHFEKSGKKIPVIVWDGKSAFPQSKPYIVVIQESLLKEEIVQSLSPDFVVIKELSHFSEEVVANYMNLYAFAGPHMSTIMNADDRAVIELAANEEIRKGRTYYFSKNSGLRDQISRIGGVISDGEKVEVFSARPHEIKLEKVWGIDEEMAYLASLASVMNFQLTVVD